jgi:putative endonuclease
MLRCCDGSFYVGSSSYDDVHLRVAEHNDARYLGYTSSRRPVTLVWAQRVVDLRDAHARERQLKGWSRAKKYALIADDTGTLEILASRRTGKPKSPPRPSRRELLNLYHSVGAANPGAPSTTGLRHPEARAAERRAPKEGR